EMLHHLTLGRLWPCATFIFDLPVAIGLERAYARQETNRYETFDHTFHDRVRTGFTTLAAHDPARCIIIDATLPLAAIHKQVVKEVNRRFGVELDVVANY